jgi:hypothetical protein
MGHHRLLGLHYHKRPLISEETLHDQHSPKSESIEEAPSLQRVAGWCLVVSIKLGTPNIPGFVMHAVLIAKQRKKSLTL